MLLQELRSPICCLTPDRSGKDRDIQAAAAAALRAGVGMIQYRAEALATADMVREASTLVRMARGARAPMIVAHRVDVALAVGADGVHLDAGDLPVAHARRLMGPGAIICADVRTPEEARIAQREGATYVALGPIYPSPSLPDAPPVGIETMARVHAATGLPICAFGGIGPDNIADVMQAGAELLAILSAIHDQPDPAAAARLLVERAASIPRPRRPAP